MTLRTLDFTWAEHAAIGIAIFVPSVAIGADPVAAAATITSGFFGREVAQHEYKLAVQRGWEYGSKMPVQWWEGIVKGWSQDSGADVIGVGSILAIAALYLIA